MTFRAGFFAAVLMICAATNAEQILCKSIHWKSEPVEIDDFHFRMICGDPNSEAWSDIPLYQAKVHLEAFLQSKGYANPVLEINKNILIVDRGPVLKLKSTESIPPNPELDRRLKRHRGKTVTPSLLNAIENTSKAFYRNRGYPCAESKSEVDIKSGKLITRASLGDKQQFGQVKIDPNHKFNSELLKRYYSFRTEDEFRLDDLSLTRQRIDESEVVSGTYFVTHCERADKNKEYLEHKYILAAPRTLRFGFGADTETGPFAYAGWKHNRLTQNLGQLSVSTTLSFERQSLSSEGKFFPSLAKPRFYYSIRPAVYRDTGTGSEEIAANIGLIPGYAWDTGARSIRLETGPYFIRTWFRTSQDQDFDRDLSLALKLDLFVMSHDYELKKAHPESGSEFSNRMEFRSPFLGFFTTLLRNETTYKKVWNLGYCGQAECFLALRQNTQLNFVTDKVDVSRIPPSLQTFLGDIRTLRGFGIENSLNPGLTQASLGLDLRIKPFSLPSFEPYLLADFGKIGKKSLHFSPDFLHAYGIGLRWFSPIGIVNGFITRSIATQSTLNSGWYFFIGLGEGF
jgi:outer membrane translocation and assembly module TamA